MKLGILADDNTGASDAAGMLTERGAATLLVFDSGDIDRAVALHERYDALVVGSRIRSVQPDTARACVRTVVGRLRDMGLPKIQLKYCSTFDSTPRGNIGPSLDACLETLEQPLAIVCPSLPVNGRTVRDGCLFVDGVPLAESPLRHHPLNPMTDSDIVRWLGYQTGRRVGLAPLDTVRRGPTAVRRHLEELAASGVAYAVTDALTDDDLATIAEATSGRRFISGASGISAAIGAELFPGREPLSFEKRLRRLKGPTLVVSGSMSPATRAQNDRALHGGFAGFPVGGAAIVAGAFDGGQLVADAGERLRAGEDVLVYSDARSADDIRRVQQDGSVRGLDQVATGELIASTIAGIARALLDSGTVRRLVVSGGETSGAVVQQTGLGLLETGLPVAPGVPCCFPLERRDLLVVLKSGNFGGADFYGRVAAL